MVEPFLFKIISITVLPMFLPTNRYCLMILHLILSFVRIKKSLMKVSNTIV